jgi:GNAT superfamily N-acetyltransferase
MQVSDLDAALDIQADAYELFLHTDRAAYEGLLQFYPQGCWVAVVDQKIAGYMMSHPSCYTAPPALGKTPDEQSIQPDCYFINDVAVGNSFRGIGVASGFAKQAIQLAIAGQYSRVTLIAVQDSQIFWGRFGFEVADIPSELQTKIRQVYGQDACYMVRET